VVLNYLDLLKMLRKSSKKSSPKWWDLDGDFSSHGTTSPEVKRSKITQKKTHPRLHVRGGWPTFVGSFGCFFQNLAISQLISATDLSPQPNPENGKKSRSLKRIRLPAPRPFSPGKLAVKNFSQWDFQGPPNNGTPGPHTIPIQPSHVRIPKDMGIIVWVP